MFIHHHRVFFRLCGISAISLAAAFGQTASSYTITTIAGNGTAGYTGDGSAATSAELNNPFTAVISSSGNLYIADQHNSCIRFVAPGGKITTAAGVCGTPGYSGDVGMTGSTGKAGAADLNYPSGVALDSSGNLFIGDTNNNLIRKVDSSQNITTFAGNQVGASGGNTFGGDLGPATSAELYYPSGVAVDPSGNLYIADTRNNAIRKVIASSGIITTVAGTGNPTGGYLGDNGPATRATLNDPTALAVDASGNLYIADTANHVIRKVSNGIITTVAGNGQPGFAGDGNKATLAELYDPKGVAVDSAGNIYISDTNNSRIRMVNSSGIISTIAGTGRNGYSGDSGPGLSAQFNFPTGISVDAKGNLYICDNQNNVIRQLTPGGQGTGGQPPAISAGGVVSLSQFGASATVAPGSWVEIYGTNLAVDTRSWAVADFSNGGQTAPVSLDRTSVTINGSQAASVYYISANQVDALLPNLGQGTSQLTITTAAGNSTAYSLTIDPAKFGVYAPAQFKVGGKQYVGAVFNDGTTFVMPPNSVSGYPSRQAHAGDIINIYGIGFGPVTNGIQPGTIAPGLSPLTGNVQVLFGTTPAVINYQGLAPQTFGEYQIQVIVPAVPAGDSIPLTITLNGVQGSQTLYTAVQ